MGPCLPALGNQGSGLRGGTLQTPSIRQREPDARVEGAYSRSPLYPPRGTRRSGRGGLLTCTPLPVSGNQTLGQRGPTHLHPSTRLGEPDARAEGAYSPAPLYPSRGTRRSGRGGLLTCTPLPVSGNQTLGQRGPTLAHPSTRLGEPDARAEGAYSPVPLYPPRGTRRSGRGGLLTSTPLPASGNQTLGQRGPTYLYPSTRLGEPDARAEGAYLPVPLYPPRGTRRSGRGGLLTCTPLPGSTSLIPGLLSSEGPLDLQEGPLPVHQANPGIPHLSPGH